MVVKQGNSDFLKVERISAVFWDIMLREDFAVPWYLQIFRSIGEDLIPASLVVFQRMLSLTF